MRLLGLGQVVSRHRPLVLEVVAIRIELGTADDPLIGLGRDAADLQVEEDQPGVDLGRFLLDLLEQRAPRGIGGIGGERQRGVPLGKRQLAENGLVFVERLAEQAGREVGPGDVAAEPGLERFRPVLEPLQVRRDAGIVDALI